MTSRIGVNERRRKSLVGTVDGCLGNPSASSAQSVLAMRLSSIDKSRRQASISVGFTRQMSVFDRSRPVILVGLQRPTHTKQWANEVDAKNAKKRPTPHFPAIGSNAALPKSWKLVCGRRH